MNTEGGFVVLLVGSFLAFLVVTGRFDATIAALEGKATTGNGGPSSSSASSSSSSLPADTYIPDTAPMSAFAKVLVDALQSYIQKITNKTPLSKQ